MGRASGRAVRAAMTGMESTQFGGGAEDRVGEAVAAWREALQRGQSVAGMPVLLWRRRLLLAEAGGGVGDGGAGDDGAGERPRLLPVPRWRRLALRLSDTWAAVQPAAAAIKQVCSPPTTLLNKLFILQIEGKFGSGVSSYFRLLRFFIYINLLVTLITLVFLFLPVVTVTDIIYTKPKFQIQDIFFGTGYLGDNFLFYNSTVFSTSSQENGYWVHFNLPQGYLCTTLFGYLIFIVSVLSGFVEAYKKSFIDSAESENKKFGTAIFTSWQMTIEDRDSANQLMNKIFLDMKKLLKPRQARLRRVSREMVAVRGLLAGLLLAATVGLCYGEWELLRLQRGARGYWLLPLALSLLLLLAPAIVSLVTRLGRYGARHELYSRLVQVGFSVHYFIT